MRVLSILIELILTSLNVPSSPLKAFSSESYSETYSKKHDPVTS